MRRQMFVTGAVMILLAGCQAEPGFDEKFEQRSRELSQQAKTIEADANAQLAAAREAEQANAELNPPVGGQGR